MNHHYPHDEREAEECNRLGLQFVMSKHKIIVLSVNDLEFAMFPHFLCSTEGMRT